VFKNGVLRSIFGPKRDEATRERRKLHSEELNEMYSSSNIIRVIKSRRMRWAVYVARMGGGKEEVYTGFWWGNLGERDHSKDAGLNRRIILRWIFRKWDGRHGID
jgi:hypothetical protein